MSTWTWHAKPTGAYSRGTPAGDDNACLIASKLMLEFGWTLEAVCGMLGNIAGEGGLNPWRWEHDNILSVSQAETARTGMGLIGWTPCAKYTSPVNIYWPWDLSTFDGYGPNFSDRAGNIRDGNAQTELIGRCMTGAGNGNFWIRTRHDWHGVLYDMRADDYIQLDNVDRAAVIWLWQAEYPSTIVPPADPTSTENRRKLFAENWYNHLIEIGFQPSAGEIGTIIAICKHKFGRL